MKTYWPILVLMFWYSSEILAQTTVLNQRESGTQLLAEHPFADGGYTILVLSSTNGWDRQPDSESVFVYFDRLEDLERLNQQLVGYEPATVYPFMCFDSHSILVCKKGEVEETITISNNCKSITASEGEFLHNGFFPFGGYKLARQQIDTFADADTARQHRQLLLTRPGLLLMNKPNWLDYDGEFGCYIDNDTAKANEVLFQLVADLKQRFPNEKFEVTIQEYGYSSTHPWNFRALVKCHKLLFDGFDLYEVDWGKWKAYPLTLESYWKAN